MTETLEATNSHSASEKELLETLSFNPSLSLEMPQRDTTLNFIDFNLEPIEPGHGQPQAVPETTQYSQGNQYPIPSSSPSTAFATLPPNLDLAHFLNLSSLQAGIQQPKLNFSAQGGTPTNTNSETINRGTDKSPHPGELQSGWPCVHSDSGFNLDAYNLLPSIEGIEGYWEQNMNAIIQEKL